MFSVFFSFFLLFSKLCSVSMLYDLQMYIRTLTVCKAQTHTKLTPIQIQCRIPRQWHQNTCALYTNVQCCDSSFYINTFNIYNKCIKYRCFGWRRWIINRNKIYLTVCVVIGFEWSWWWAPWFWVSIRNDYYWYFVFKWIIVYCCGRFGYC